MSSDVNPSAQWEYFFDIQVFFKSYRRLLSQISDQARREEELGMGSIKDLDIPYTSEYQDFYALAGMSDLYYESSLIVLFSFLESSLLRLCQRLEKDQLIKLNDLGGKGLRKSRLYLTKVCKVEFGEVDNLWDFLLKYSLFRNFLVHSHGTRTMDPKKEQQLLQFIKSLNGMFVWKINPNETVWNFHILSRAPIDELLSASEAMLKYLYVDRKL